MINDNVAKRACTGREAAAPLRSLQAGRGVAALLVLLFHENRLFLSGKYFATSPFGHLFDFGDAGVYFFFVLSGFIILHAHAGDIGRPRRLAGYVTKRVIRIYPFYLLVMAGIFVLYLLHPQFGSADDRDIWNIVSSLTLISDGTQRPVLAVSWTLFHEIMFYALFAAAIWNARLGTLILAVWIGASLFFLNGSGRSGFFFSPLHLLFGMGMSINLWLRSDSRIPARTFAALGTAAFLAIGIDKVYLGIIPGPILPLAYGAAAALAVLGLARMESSGRMYLPAWLLLAGDASYAIYLVHFPVLSELAKVLGGLVPRFVSFLILMVFAAFAGCAAHLLVERPTIAYLRGRFAQPKRLTYGAAPGRSAAEG